MKNTILLTDVLLGVLPFTLLVFCIFGIVVWAGFKMLVIKQSNYQSEGGEKNFVNFRPSQSYVHLKIKKTIDSCDSVRQVEACRNYVELYKKMYGEDKNYKRLYNQWRKKFR